MQKHRLLAAGAFAPAAHERSRPVGAAVLTNGSFRRNADGDYATIHTGRPPKSTLRPQAATPEKILQAFNTWAFKREQPDDAQSILKVVTESTWFSQPVPFVLYWGKGPRRELDEPDTTCLDFLAALAARVRSVYEPGASFKLICTDTHANLNGHAAQDIAEYFSAVETAARERGFDSCWLSELVFNAEAAGAVDGADEPVEEETLRKLGLCAAKWFRGEGTAEDGAARYFQMNMIEKQAVQFAFPRSIFVTFNGSEYRCLFPERMPIFYMYSLRRGVSVKPGFNRS